MTEIPKNIDEAWGLFNSRRFEHGRDESMYNSFSTALAGLFAGDIHFGSMPCESFAKHPSPVDRESTLDTCPICAEPLVPDDICATDIEMGICHAACLEGSPVVDPNTGEAIPDGKIDTYRYGDDPLAANLNAQCRRGDWMQTVTGRQFWPLDPRADDIDIEDIAHALSMMCRFGGHCDRFYSVAEHSVLVSENVPPEDGLWGLLHDASEAYIAANIMSAIRIRFNLPGDEPSSVKRADNAILADEAEQIMGAKPKDWILPEPPLGVRIAGLSPRQAKAAFLARYRDLTEIEQ